jgi:Ser/Thr protein kinase RdoA (MazF antagonist)
MSRSMRDSRLNSVDRVDIIFAQAIAEKYFGIQATAAELPSERDQNFLLETRAGEKFVLKIASAFEEKAVLEAQNAMMTHLRERFSFCPRIVPALSGEEIVLVEGRMVRVLSYLPGKPLASVAVQSRELLFDFGRRLGQLSRALVGFDHPAARRDFYWDLANGVQTVREFGPQINTDWLREMVTSYGRDLCLSVEELRRSVVYGDANDYNVLVDAEEKEVVGLIDFGDIVYSYRVGDLAIAIAYVVLGKDDPYAAAQPVIAGYLQEFELTKAELEALWPLVRLRLCMSASIAAQQQAQQPENEYLGISQALIEQTLPKLLATDSHR